MENRQTVVFAAYVTARGHTVSGFRLYLPKQWCQDSKRREQARVPDEVEFATEPVLGTAMITGAADARVPFAWAPPIMFTPTARRCGKRVRRRTRVRGPLSR